MKKWMLILILFPGVLAITFLILTRGNHTLPSPVAWIGEKLVRRFLLEMMIILSFILIGMWKSRIE